MKYKARLVFSLLSTLGVSLISGCGNINPSPAPDPGPTPEPEDPFPTNPEDSWCIDTTGKIQYVRKQSVAAGLNAASDTKKYQCEGTDLGFTWYDSAKKQLFVTFGDSFATHKMSGTWNSNVTLYTKNFDFTKGVQWEGALNGQNGASKQITPITQNVATRNGWQAAAATDCEPLCSTTIPTGGIVINGTYYLFYMEVYKFNQTHDYPGVTRNGMWDTFASRVVKSTDGGVTWTLLKDLKWQAHNSSFECQPGESFSQIHPLDIGDEYIYIYGIPGGREGGTCMGRVLKANFENINEYEYFAGLNNGNPLYKKGNNGLAFIKGKSSCYVIQPKCGELNFSYNPYFKKYMVSYLSAQSQIVYRLMENPYTFGGQIAIANQNNLPCLYGGATHEVMFDHDGRRMFMFICQWNDKLYSTNLCEIVFRAK